MGFMVHFFVKDLQHGRLVAPGFHALALVYAWVLFKIPSKINWRNQPSTLWWHPQQFILGVSKLSGILLAISHAGQLRSSSPGTPCMAMNVTGHSMTFSTHEIKACLALRPAAGPRVRSGVRPSERPRRCPSPGAWAALFFSFLNSQSQLCSIRISQKPSQACTPGQGIQLIKICRREPSGVS